MSDNPLDIILVNYNSTDHLLACLESIFDDLGDIPARVIVQDNDSRDGVDRIRERLPRAELVENKANLGFARAVNKALRSSVAPYGLILNPDTYISKGFFRPLMQYMEAHPEVGVLGPAVMNGDGSLQGSARSYPSPLTAVFGRSSILSKWFPNNPLTSQNLLTTRSDGHTPMEVDWVSGACMLVRRRAMAEVGLLDERFFMYWEDADWCRRFWDREWKVVYFPRVSIVHYVGVSSTKNPFRSALEFHKSSYRLFGKYAHPSLLPLKPLVIGGLSLRVLPILISGAIQAISGGNGAKRSRDKAPLPRDSRIKVLRMIARLNIGGPAIHVHLLARGLDGGMFETTVVSGKIPAQEGDMGYLFGATDKQPLIIPFLQREISLA
ncbi:MAG: glycosyltransferase family 2 protein, partial [Deltaproteobacteria bacterium]|nr:glycosyltransferase family 2 protein [Deltaproteobacteria bacterium]